MFPTTSRAAGVALVVLFGLSVVPWGCVRSGFVLTGHPTGLADGEPGARGDGGNSGRVDSGDGDTGLQGDGASPGDGALPTISGGASSPHFRTFVRPIRAQAWRGFQHPVRRTAIPFL